MVQCDSRHQEIEFAKSREIIKERGRKPGVGRKRNDHQTEEKREEE